MTRLEEIRERWEKATPGPWRWSNTSSEAYLFGARSLVVMAFKRMGMNGAQPVFRREDNILYPAGKENINAFPDAQAIATAPEDIAFLLAEVETAGDPWKVAADELCKYGEEQEARAKKAEALVKRLLDVHAEYFSMDRDPELDDTTPEPEDVWRYDRDFRKALEPVCDCYPGGFTPDSFEGPKEDCPVHGREGNSNG